MWTTHLLAVVALVLLVVGWAGVQSAWRRVFRPARPDLDVLAGRGGCGGCDHECNTRRSDR